MNGYTDHKLTLRLKAGAGTPWQADTLFGHMVWQVAYGALDGLEVSDFLDAFCSNAPPFILSDAFPRGLMPRPLLPSAAEPQTTDPEAYAQAKRRRKAAYVTAADFDRLRRGLPAEDPPVDEPWDTTEVVHAAISRVSWTTSGDAGNLYTVPLRYLRKEFDDTLELYVRAREGWIDKVQALLRAVARVGFGRDASTGSGAFEVRGCEPHAFDADAAEWDGFVALSSFVPAAGDPADGFWATRTKFGKLGPGAGQGNPFKRPLVQLCPGSAFRCDAPRPFYGRMVKNIAPGMPEAVQYGLCLPAPSVCSW